jgi:hypothetical protein
MRPGRAQGFTLVEALIAATIFFSSIVVISEAYRASLAASRKAELTATLLAPVPLLVSRVSDQLRERLDDSWREQGRLLGVDFKITANVARRVAPPARIDPDSGLNVKSAARFKMFEITIDLAYAGQRRVFKYEELAWAPPENVP